MSRGMPDKPSSVLSSHEIINNETTRGTASESTLAGAEFKLYQYTVPDGSSTGSYTVYPDVNNCTKMTSSESSDHGTLVFNNLPDGHYRIEESKSPDGYIKTENNDIYFDIVDGIVTRYNSAYTGMERQVSEEISETSNVAKITYTKANGSHSAAFIVGNEPGAALPNTGGPGTAVLYLLGIMLTGLAGAGLVMKRKRKAA